MRITWKDGLATLFVLVSAGLYGLWVSGVAAQGMGVRALAVVVFALGFAGCVSASSEMAEVFKAGADRTVPLGYQVLASLVGAVALVSGVLAMIRGSEPMLAAMVVATVALWLAATVRHGVEHVHSSPAPLAH
jgi:hypothetical protein